MHFFVNLYGDNLVKYAIALQDDGTPIHVKNATRVKDYRCLSCSKIVRRKGGNKREDHFFHLDEAHDHDIQSIIHDETCELIYAIFRHLINSSTSFVWIYECKDSNIEDSLFHKYDKIPYNLNTQYGKSKRLLVANSKIKYDFLKGIDNVKWEASFENGKFRPDISLCRNELLVLPFEIYYSSEDSDEKTAWYKDNNKNVVKIDVSTNVDVKLDDIRALRKDWETNKEPHTIFNQLKVTININSEITCLIPNILTTVEMLREKIKTKCAEKERRKQRQKIEQERHEGEKLKKERLERQGLEREKLKAQNLENRNQSQPHTTIIENDNKIENKMVKEIEKKGITEMEEVLKEIHKIVKTKIVDHTLSDDPDIVRALRICRYTEKDIGNDLNGNTAQRSAVVLAIYNNR